MSQPLAMETNLASPPAASGRRESLRGAGLAPAERTAVSQPGDLPGVMPSETLDRAVAISAVAETRAVSTSSAVTRGMFSLRGEMAFTSSRVAALSPAHPSTGGSGDIRSVASTFTMRGELMHAFLSYRVSTEGPAGNGLSSLIAQKIRFISTDSRQGLLIPRHGWGIWPKSAKQPVPFRAEEAKVWLDKECLLDGQSWLGGFVQGLATSMVIVPVLTWEDGDRGSIGELSRIGVDGFDKVDNVLLELILALALREAPGAAAQAILPVLLGPAKEGGGFAMFPFHKLARLSDEPSRETTAQAGQILRSLGLGGDAVQGVLGLSVKQVVDEVLRNQGVQASEWGDVEGVVKECGTRVLQTVLREMRRLRSDPKYFSQGAPMGSEVLEWLQEENLRSYAPLFVHHNFYSLEIVARLKPEKLCQLFEEHEELFPRIGRKGAIGGQLVKLEMAHSKLLCATPARLCGLIPSRADDRALPLSERLEGYRDIEGSFAAIATSGNGLELWFTQAGWTYALLMICFATVAFLGWALGTFKDNLARGLFGAAVMLAGGAFKPVFAKTARQFVTLLQWWLPLVFLDLWVALLLDGIATSNLFRPFFWAPFLISISLSLRFRPGWHMRTQSAILTLGFVAQPPLVCISLQASSYGECVKQQYQDYALIIGLLGVDAVANLAKTIAKHSMARHAFEASRDSHRALWREELSIVAGSPEVLEGLRSVADGIARELQDQRTRVVRSLGVVAKVTAIVKQRAGRWSLRGCKLCQAHGDIDLLFDEAAMVNEPFLDLMASLVAGIGGVDGEADGRPGLTLVRGPIKRPARALQKLVRVYGRDVAMLTDLVRCTVVAEDLREVEALMTTLDAWSVVGLAGVARTESRSDEEPLNHSHEEQNLELVELNQGSDARRLRITAIKNRFDETYDDSESGGYRDLSVSVEVGWVMREGLVSFERVRDWEALECQRHICEIQVHLRSQHAQITEGLHKRYVELRNQYNV